jgi:protein O-mannosyl-transferase
VGPRAALLAALLFAAHPVHVEAVALGVNQGELIVGLLGLFMARRYIDARRGGDLDARDWVAISLMYAAAALTKENGFVLPFLLVAAEIIVGEGSTLRERAAATWLGFAALAVVGAAIALCRVVVLDGSAVGATVAHALRGIGLWERVLVMLQVVPMWFRLLVWPARLQADYGAGDIHLPGRIGAGELVGVALILAAAALIWMARTRVPAVSFGLAWCVVALLPVSNLVPTGILLAERTLFLPSVGFVIAVAGAGEWLATRSRWSGATTRRVLSVVAVACVVLGVVRSESRHLVWNSRHLVVKRP